MRSGEKGPAETGRCYRHSLRKRGRRQFYWAKRQDRKKEIDSGFSVASRTGPCSGRRRWRWRGSPVLHLVDGQPTFLIKRRFLLRDPSTGGPSEAPREPRLMSLLPLFLHIWNSFSHFLTTFQTRNGVNLPSWPPAYVSIVRDGPDRISGIYKQLRLP